VNRDPFLRAALIVALTGFAAGLYALFGIVGAAALAAVGIVSALFVSVDYTPTVIDPLETVERPERPRNNSEKTFERVDG
jgi:fatty acid desaturase